MSEQTFTFRVEDQGVKEGFDDALRREQELTDRVVEGNRRKADSAKEYEEARERGRQAGLSGQALDEYTQLRVNQDHLGERSRDVSERRSHSSRAQAREEGFGMAHEVLDEKKNDFRGVEGELKTWERRNRNDKEEADIQSAEIRRAKLSEKHLSKDDQKAIESEYRDSLKENREKFELGQLQIRYAREQIQALRENSQEIRESKEGRKAISTGDVSQLTPEQAYQANYIRSTKPKGAGASDFLKREGGVLGEFASGAAGLAIGGGIVAFVLSALSGLNSMEAEASRARTGEHYDLEMVSKIPFSDLFFGTGFKRRTLEEETKLELNQMDLRGQTGKFHGFLNIPGIGSVSNIGYTTNEALEMRSRLIREAGFEGDSQEFNDIMVASRAWGLDPSELISIGQMSPYNKDSFRRTTGPLASKLIEQGSRANLGEATDALVRLFQDTSSRVENVSGEQVANAILPFHSIGGGWSDPRSVERITGLSRSLANPQGDYDKMINNQILSKINPGSSWLELKMAEEQGISAPGFLQGFLERTKEDYGNSEWGVERVKQRFGLSYSQSNLLYRAFIDNPDLFSKIGEKATPEEVDASMKEVYGDAWKNVSPRLREEKRIEEAHAKGGGAAERELEEQSKVYDVLHNLIYPSVKSMAGSMPDAEFYSAVVAWMATRGVNDDH